MAVTAWRLWRGFQKGSRGACDMKGKGKLEENVLVLKEAKGWDKGWEVPLPCDRDHTRLST